MVDVQQIVVFGLVATAAGSLGLRAWKHAKGTSGGACPGCGRMRTRTEPEPAPRPQSNSSSDTLTSPATPVHATEAGKLVRHYCQQQ